MYRLVLERGVPQEEHHRVAIGSLTDWDAARVFLEVVRCGSFRSAAERLELSINVVRRRIDDFERQIGATLFTRDVHGTRLTDEGALVVSAVERMEAASFDVRRQFSHHAFGRSPGRHHRRLGNVLAGPSPCRVSAIIPEHSRRSPLCDAFRRRIKA